MSEVIEMKPERTLKMIEDEVQPLYAKAGFYQYLVLCNEGELAHVNKQILALQVETQELKKKEKQDGSTEVAN